jgi:hypothetical protein
MQIVPKISATVQGAVDVEQIGLYKDHRDMSKFMSIQDVDFGVISSILQDMLTKAPSLIKKRWTQFIDKGGMY